MGEILLIIPEHIDNRQQLINSIQPHVHVILDSDVNTKKIIQYERIGFIYHQSFTFPFSLNNFSSITNTRNGHTYFQEEWIDFFSTHSKIIDLITCDYEYELSEILDSFKIISIINYSTDITGNTPIGDWILEKTINGSEIVDLKSIYFNDNISNWNVYLGYSDHSLLLDANYKVYSFGANSYGQLGRYTGGDNSFTPAEINGVNLNGSKIKAISTSGYNSLILDENGIVYSFGRNDYGQLGRDTGLDYSNTPTEINGVNLNGSKIKAISCGFLHYLILDENGIVYSFGSNLHSALGRDTELRYSITPTEINGVNLNGSKIKAISSGVYHSIILDENGVVYSFGVNNYGQMGRYTESDSHITPTEIN